MHVSRSKVLTVFFLSFVPVLTWVLSAQGGTSVIDPGSINQVNPGGGWGATWDGCRTNGDPYWDDRGELIGSQGNFTDAVTGKTMVGLEGILLSNNAKNSKGNGPGDDYELNFNIRSNIDFKARVYLLMGIRHVFSETPTADVKAAFDDDSYSPWGDADNVHSDRTWVGLDANGDPIASAPVFKDILRRPGGMPMVFHARDGAEGEEYFAFYHDFDPGASVGIYGGYSTGSNYFVFAEPVPKPDEPTTDNLPPIWTAADIGDTKPGATHYDHTNSEWIISANGGDIWGSADAFRYVYTEHSGDFTVQARYNWLLHVGNDWGKIGLMVRDSTDPGSAHAFMSVRANNDYRGIQYRGSQGSGSSEGPTAWGGPVMPKWFRFQRAGNTFTGYFSDDGINWTEHGSQDVTLTDPVLVGMAVTSHIGGTLTTASLRNTYVSGKGLVFAHAGSDQSVDQGAADTFVLDGSGSLDADQFLWEQLSPAAPNVIPDPSAQTQTINTTDFEIFGDTTFTFRLTATNTTTGASQTSTIEVFVKDKEQANAGPDQDVAESKPGAVVTVHLDGSASTGVITQWLWEQVSGPDVSPVFNPDKSNPYFFTGDYTDDQVIQFRLTINGGEDVDYVNINVTDAERALANAGADQEGYEMRNFQLDATGSTSRDGEPYTNMTYSWQQVGGPSVYKFEGSDTATPTFIAPEIPLTQWPPWRDLTFSVTVTAPNGSTDSDTVTVTARDHEFETVFYREHEDFDFHNSPEDGRWYPAEAEYGVHYCWGKVGNEVYGTFGRLNPTADYWWNNWGGWHDYRDGVSLGTGGEVPATCGTDWKSGWINPGANDYWKYTFELPHGSANAYIVNWLSTNNSWHGNSRAYYDYEQGNTSPVGVFRMCRRGWDNFKPLISPPFQVDSGLHKITLDAYGAGEPNYSRFELHVPMPGKNIADAGPDQGAVQGELVTLDGRGSQAVSTTYAWEQVSPDAPEVTLSDAGNGFATFTAPAVTEPTDFIFRLTIAGATNDSVDFATVTVIPEGEIFALFADQRNARDPNLVTDWGNRDVGGAEWGSDYEAGNWGALPPESRLSSDVIVHHNNHGGSINLDCWSEFRFNVPDGAAGEYYLYVRCAHKNGDSAFIRVNEGVQGIWPTDGPPNNHHRIANNTGNRGQMTWGWNKVDGNTAPPLADAPDPPARDVDNEVRIYGRESKCNQGRPFIWDAIIFSKNPLDRGQFEKMDRIAMAARIPVVAELIADAGDDFSVLEGATAVLDGTGSSGVITSYQWTQTAGPGVTINNADQAVANFVAPNVTGPTTATFELTVSDGTNSDSDTVDVLILEPGPAPPPTNLTAEGVELGVKLSWDPSLGAATYKILRREVGVPWPFDVLVAEGVGGTSLTDTSMPILMDMTYSYTVIAVNAFGESAPALPAQAYALSANLALRSDASPFAKKPHPGWNLDLVMNNRIKEENFDSWYYSQPSADDWWGYSYPQPMYFQEIHYYPGNVFGDGGWWTSLGVQFTKDGETWYDIPNVTIDPPYDFTDSPDGRSPGLGQLPYVRRHILRFPKVEGIAVRIYGAPGGSNDFTSVAELELYGVPGPEGYLYSFAGADFGADEGTTATLDGSDSSTPLAVAFQWEQVTGAGGQVTQVDMSSAFNRDVIYAEGEDLAAQDAFEPGGPNYLYSSNAAIAPAGSNPLPANGVVGPFQLGSYTQDNCLLLSDQQRGATVPFTPGNYGYLDVVFSGASGNHWTQLYLNYANGDSPVIWFEFSDWFYRGDVERAWQNSFRVSRNDGSVHWADGDPGGPNLYRRRIPVDPNRTLLSATFAGFPGNGNQTGGVFAMNLGPPVPILQINNANSAVATFNVPEITQDQVVTFGLTVWDAANNSAYDEVDVTLVDVQGSKTNAGPDALEVQPFTNVVLDGSGTGGDIISYKWEQIGGPPAVAFWNTDQAQGTIIAPSSGTLMYKLTTVAANGTVSSDTMIVTVLTAIGDVPASGYIQDVLMLGTNYDSRFTSNHEIDHDHLAAAGGQANQLTPNAGDSVDIGGETFTSGSPIWTPMHRDNGWWFDAGHDNYCAYFHVYIISPEQRDARAIIRHDDEMRCWNNGALSFMRNGWDGGGEQSLDFTLFEGVNSMTFKLNEGGGGDYLAVRFTDRNNNQYNDLKWAYNYSDLVPPAVAIPDPPDGIVVDAGSLFYLDGRQSADGGTYTWEQVWPQDPVAPMWFGDDDVTIVGAPLVDEDTDFYFRLWVDIPAGTFADVVKVTVATKQIPGAVSNVTGEWAGDVGAVLRWNKAAHASSYVIERAQAADGPYGMAGTAVGALKFVDTGPLDPDGTYYYRIVPASILNVGPASDPIAISIDPNLGNVSMSDLAVPIVGQPSPTGGGSRDIGIIKDTIVSGQNYDTFDGNTPNPGTLQGEETFEFFGYLFDSAVEIHSLVYYTGGVFGDGGWWTTLGVQVTRDGGATWQDAPCFVSGPVYNTADSGAGRSWNEKYIISITPDVVDGVRIAGHAGGSNRFVSIAELEAYGDVGGLNVNAGPDQTVDEKDVVTLDGSATTGATDLLWTQVAGPSVVITNADQPVASFTAPGVFFMETLTFRLTGSNPQWTAFDEVNVTVMDIDSYHIYRYLADFDGRSETGRLIAAAGEWGTGAGFQHDFVQRMPNVAANEAASAGAVSGNDYFFQNTSQDYQQYRPALNPFDVRFRDFGNGVDEPFVGYTTVNDWWNFTFTKISKTEDTGFPVEGVMAIAALASSGYAEAVIEVYLDEQLVTNITFAGTGWGDFRWHRGAGTFLVTAGTHTIRLRLAQGGWDVCKFRLDLSQPQIESVTKIDDMATIKWNDVQRTYVLQATDDIEDPTSWTDIYGPTTETSVTGPIPPDKLMFYRIAVY